MEKKRIFLVALLPVSILAAGAYLRSINAVALLVRNKQAIVEVNGVPVRGEVLEGRLTAIVTRRDTGKTHSYRIFFDGDVDATGDAGFVVDCHAWIAPRLPFLLETANYPPCNILSEDVYKDRRWPLFDRGRFIEFVINDRTTIRIDKRNKKGPGSGQATVFD